MMKIKNFFQNDWLFTVSMIVALMSCLLGQFKVSFIDNQVILSLFGLMLIIKAFERLGILDFVAEKLVVLSKNNRSLVRNLMFLSFFSSMLLTNDVAILTLLPIFLRIVGKTVTFTDK